jgi:hypothetical protein
MSEMQLRLREELEVEQIVVVGFFETWDDNVVSYGLLTDLYEREMEMFG